MAKVSKKASSSKEAVAAFDAIVKSGVIRPDVTIQDLMNATRSMNEVGVEWAAVYDSERWGFILK